ncbi:hypothetical protein SDJN02_05901 [Cucurbita argyrosperma subsp. argyrosperma]
MILREKRYDGDCVGPRFVATLYRSRRKESEHGADSFVVALNAYSFSYRLPQGIGRGVALKPGFLELPQCTQEYESVFIQN